MESIGSMEEVIMMVLLKYERCPGVDIIKYYEEVLEKKISLPAVHVALKRMEKKGWVESEFGEPTSRRGGRRQRVYWATPYGYRIVREVQEAKIRFWNSIPPPIFRHEVG